MPVDIVNELRALADNAPARPQYATELYGRAANEIESLRAQTEFMVKEMKMQRVETFCGVPITDAVQIVLNHTQEAGE